MNKPLRKALIPAAGLGTRMLPAAKAVPKELLPILDRPTIQYVVEEAAVAGLSDVLMISATAKPALLAHFLPNRELSDRLKKTGKAALLASIDELMSRVTISTVMQDEQLGLGDAVLRGRAYIGDEPFLCLLGDTIFSGADELPAQQLADAYKQFGGSIIGLEEVPAEKVSRYGIVGGNLIGDGIIRIDRLVEKPSVDRAPSQLAIAARYVLSPAVFQLLAEVNPGVGGEIQLTDALAELCQREPMHGVILKSKRHDIGNPIDWLKTNIAYAAADQVIWKQIAPLLRSLLDRSSIGDSN
jgi:UTP--glucose-1-phosphate uridylyltransferase